MDSEFNLLPGNTSLSDKGSVYYLIDTEQGRKEISAPSAAALSPGDHHYHAYVGAASYPRKVGSQPPTGWSNS